MKLKLPIILIGFMGTGKTTFGTYLSQKQNLKFIDLDSYIEQMTGLSIPLIFEKYGEAFFRQQEFKALNEVIENYDIIATGGGIIEGDNAFEFLKEYKNVLWLDSDIDTIYNRIVGDSNRPNANGKSRAELYHLYSKRVSRYNEIAFMKLNTVHPLEQLYANLVEERYSE